MAILSSQRKNIIDWGKQLHRGEFLPEVMMLAQQNQNVMDVPFSPCNDGTTHLYRVQTKLPTAQKTAWGQGTTPSTGQSAQERAHCTMMTSWASVEEEMTKIGGIAGAARAAEDMNHYESLKQLMAEEMIFGNRGVDPLGIDGFATLYNDKAGPKAKQFFDCAGAGNHQTTAILVNWGADVYGIFPEGTTAGYQKKVSNQTVTTLANGNKMFTADTQHLWHFGLVVEAWQSVARVVNIDVPDLLAMSVSQAPTSFTNVLHGMITLRKRIRRPGNPVWYVNETVWTYLMRLALEKSAAAVTIEKAATQFGTFEEMTILGTPVRLCDRILNTMAAI